MSLHNERQLLDEEALSLELTMLRAITCCQLTVKGRELVSERNSG